MTAPSPATSASAAQVSAPRLQFNRRELAGAFGDIGTDLPIIAGLLLATGLDPAGVLLAFGLAQIATGLLYGLPMPVQPLKAMAVVVVAGQASGGLLHLAGLLIGIVMLVLSLSGGLDWLGRAIPHPVVRGIQAGLGLALGRTALKLINQPAGNPWAWLAAAAAVVVLVSLRRQHRLPGALIVIGAAALWTAFHGDGWRAIAAGVGFARPHPATMPWNQWLAALTLLVLPQLPLSLANSVIATQRTTRDLFPGREIALRSIGLTYAGINLLAPWLGGIPVCHGCGGLAGYYALGARTGGAAVIYGALFVVGGLLFSGAFAAFIHAFPACVLGALLLVEAAVLFLLLGDLRPSPPALALAAAVAATCVFAPQGYLVGTLGGAAIYYALRRVGVAFSF
jgi:hypothetical protein